MAEMKEIKDASVGTEKFSRERFSVLPETKSRFCQTEASWLRSRSVAVNTEVDPYFGVWRRRRARGTLPLSSTTPRETQTDQIICRDVAIQVQLCCKPGDIPVKKVPSKKPVEEVKPSPSIIVIKEDESLELQSPTPPLPPPPEFKEPVSVSPDPLPLPPPPPSVSPRPRTRAPSTTDGNSNNPSEYDSDDERGAQEAVQLRALQLEQEQNFFEKYAMKPRKTLKHIKAKRDSKKSQLKVTRVEQPSTSEESAPDEEVDIEENSALPEEPSPPPKKSRVVRKISNVEIPTSTSPPSDIRKGEKDYDKKVASKEMLEKQDDTPRKAPEKVTEERINSTAKDGEVKKDIEKERPSATVQSSVQPSTSTALPQTSMVETVSVDSQDHEKGEDKRMIIRVQNPGEMKTESKIVIEVINARRREVSEVTSYSEVQEDGRITRKTTVTTSKKVPVISVSAIGHDPGISLSRKTTAVVPRHPGKTPEPIVTSPPSTRAPSSPVTRHVPITTTIESVAPSEVSTRPTSALDEAILGSYGSTPDMGSFISPAYSDPEVAKMAKLVAQVLDPYHLVINRPPLESEAGDSRATTSSPTKQETKKVSHLRFKSEEGQTPSSFQDEGYLTQEPSVLGGQVFHPQGGIIWHETASSTVTNEMVTDPFRDDEGNIQRPRSISMSTETLIDSSGKDSQIKTKSKAKRQFFGEHEEPEICAETSVADTPPIRQIEVPFSRRRRSEPLQPPYQAMPAITNGSTETINQTPVYTRPEESDRPPISQLKPRPHPRSSRIAKHEMSASSPVLDRSQRRSDPIPSIARSVQASSTSTVSSVKSPRTSIKSPPTFLESSLDDIETEVQNVLSSPVGDFSTNDTNRTGTAHSPETAIYSQVNKKSRREKIKESARQGRLFSEIPSVSPPLKTKSLSFANLSNGHEDEEESYRLSPHDHLQQTKSTLDLSSVVDSEPVQPKLKKVSSGTELVTRIIRRTHPSKSDQISEAKEGAGAIPKRMGRSEMVLEQDIKSGDGIFDTDGCHMTSSIKVDNLCLKGKSGKKAKSAAASLLGRLKKKNSQQSLMIRDREEEERRKTTEIGASRSTTKATKMQFSKSLGDLREPFDEDNDEEQEGQGVMVTETKFQRLKPQFGTGRTRNETSWEYNLECKCINGLNTSVRTNVRHKRSYVPRGLTLYESSV